jgi:histidine ammonia-lyase
MPTITIEGNLTLDAFTDIVEGNAHVVVAPSAMEQVRQCHVDAREIARMHPTYGRGTGVGANKTTTVTLDEESQGISLLRSHSVDAGKPYGRREVRAMLAIRLNQLCNPGSGIDPAILPSLADMLNADKLPQPRRYGSVGTADLTALAGTALAMIGERPLLDAQGKADGNARQLAHFTSQSALPFISSSAMTLGETLLTCVELQRILDAEAVAYTLAMLVESGNPSPLQEAGARAVAVDEAQPAAENIRRLLDGCAWEPHNIQDAYALRAWLPLRASTLRSLHRLEQQILDIANIAQENPLFLSERLDVVHHAAFLQAALAHEIAGISLAIAQEAPLLLARITSFNDSKNTGLPRFLAPEQAGTSGTMIVEYVAASAEGEIFASATPVCAHGAVLSNGLEEDASFATTEAEQLQRSTEALTTMVSCELLVAIRAARMKHLDEQLPQSSPLRGLFELTSVISSDTADRDLRDDLQSINDLIADIATC